MPENHPQSEEHSIKLWVKGMSFNDLILDFHCTYSGYDLASTEISGKFCT